MHLSSHKEWFHDYETIFLIKIHARNKSIQEAIGKGNMDVIMEIGENSVRGTFTNVLHILKIPFYE
jgi:hypothetical protein